MVGPSTRKLCRYPGAADVRTISEVLRRDRAEREKAAGEGWKQSTLAFRARESEKGMELARDGIGMLTRHHGNVCRRVCIPIRALISFPQPAHFFFRPSGDGIRSRARGGSRIIKDGLTIFPGVPGGRGQCDGALRGICRCTRCCVCFY